MAVMVYDKAKVPDPPASWAALTTSAWKGAVGMNDPSQSGPTFPFIAGMMNYLSRAECRSRAVEMLGRVGLRALADRYPNELSGGEQQRVALARALIADTGLILCDEPLSNLDADLRERMRVEISALVREAAATTVYITHDQAEAFALADKVGVLELTGVFADVKAPRGETVGLRLDPAGCHVSPADQEKH